MEFIDIPTEQTTAITDAILALCVFAIIIFLYRTQHRRDQFKTNIWLGAFGLLTFASVIGAVAHGLKLPATIYTALWQPINLALGLTIAFFVTGVVYDLRGRAVAQRVRPLLIGAAIIFYIITVLISGTFLVFILYEAVAMLFALGGYGWLALRKQLAGAGSMATGVLFTIVAAAVQASNDISVTFIWQFDHNGLFHLIQVIGILFLAIGLV
ncbi:MAG: hypothetical protein HZC38_19210 [Chloroflexi bacterium]|nr:hypothetical protein [Chloroflexota bacterium]